MSLPPGEAAGLHPIEALMGPLDIRFEATGVAGPAREACPECNGPLAECGHDDDGIDIPLDEGEEVISQTVRIEDGETPVLYLTTTAGRKVGIDPDGWMSVATGPELDVILPPVPKPPRKSWKEPRP